MQTIQTRQKNNVLAETLGTFTGLGVAAKNAALMIAGVLILAVCAKLSVPMWPAPITMGTFAVLGLGAAYGPRLGLATIAAYIACGALGLDVFAGSSAGNSGLSYMMGGTGGYLVGYVLATLVLGFAARAGLDRTPLRLATVLLVGNALIYLPGLFWLGTLHGWDKPILEWGLTPFLVGDVLKLVLAALVIPGAWRLVDRFKG